jgi:hypothetical protein
MKLTMIFFCDTDSADLEYSWVPTGNRETIRLGDSQVGTQTDTVDSDVPMVQVYRVATKVLGLGWNFPLKPISNSPIIAVTVQAVLSRGWLVGTVYYADGTSVSETHAI